MITHQTTVICDDFLCLQETGLRPNKNCVRFIESEEGEALTQIEALEMALAAGWEIAVADGRIKTRCPKCSSRKDDPENDNYLCSYPSTKTIHSPNDIEVLLHYHVSPTIHPRISAPAVAATTAMLLRTGCIERDPEHAGQYRTTLKGRALVQALCDVEIRGGRETGKHRQ